MARSRNGVTRMRNKTIRPTRSRSSSSYTSSLMGRDLFTADISFGSSFFGTSSSSTEPTPQDGLWEEDASGINSEPIVVHGPVEVRDGKFVYHENAARSVQVAGPAMGVFGEEEGQTPEEITRQDRRERRKKAVSQRKWDPDAGMYIYQLYDPIFDSYMEDENVIRAIEQAWEESRPYGDYRNENEKPIEQGGWILPDGNGGYFLKRRPDGEGYILVLGEQPDAAVASFHTHPNKYGKQGPSSLDLKRLDDKKFTVPMIIRAMHGYYFIKP